MKRYNQGFGKFGPMEQCDDGEWVKYEDYRIKIDELENKHFEKIAKYNIEWLNVLAESEEVLLKYKKDSQKWNFIAVISLAVNAGFIVSEIIKIFL